VKANTGGAPGVGSGIAILAPVIPWAADRDKNGQLLKPATVAGPPEASVPAPTIAERKQARLQRQNSQALTLKRAAENGTPFCEVCS
ncbi:hypothetical protein, partial [Pseudomonas sp. R4(2017)]